MNVEVKKMLVLSEKQPHVHYRPRQMPIFTVVVSSGRDRGPPLAIFARVFFFWKINA